MLEWLLLARSGEPLSLGDFTGILSSQDPHKQADRPERAATIELTLPGERYRDVTFSFKVPPRDTLVASANRMLKSELPARRDIRVYERLIKTNVLSAGLSKKALEALPFPFLEQIYVALWHRALGESDIPRDETLSLHLLLEEMAVFEPAVMVREDIQLLGLHEVEPMHSYYYRGELGRENMAALLAGHHYRTDWLEIPEASPELAYLACRRLSLPLPWGALLDSLEKPELERFPRLDRLARIDALLRTASPGRTFPEVRNLSETVHRLNGLLNSPDLRKIGAETGLSRPARLLVIVEGETEKLLLPLFAQAKGLDFNALGIDVQPAGGKNHVLSLYRDQAQLLRIPIFIVLDADARDIAEELRPELRAIDHIFEIKEGEFEDMYDLKLTLATLNRYYQPFPEVTPLRYNELGEASHARGRVQTLKAVWQSYGLGSFDKIEFAARYGEMFRASGHPLPASILGLLERILNVRAGVS